MRKVTSEIRAAFISGQKRSVGNTNTDGETVWLFGNAIIKKVDSHIEFTLAGWNTVTTRERIKGITGINLYQSGGLPMVDGQVIEDTGWYEISLNNALPIRANI